MRIFLKMTQHSCQGLHSQTLFSPRHFPIHRIDEGALIELGHQTRIDNVFHRHASDFRIEFRKKLSETVDTCMSRLRLRMMTA
jgi:hypothetical protein